MAETARLFVAVLPPPAILDAVAGLDRPAEPGVRYTTRNQWHVTLRFLGTVEVEEAARALERVVAPPAQARLGPAVARLGRSVVVVPVAGLDEVATAVRRATATIGEPPDPRPFAGHLTVARLRDRPACGVAGQRIDAAFDVAEVHLVRSFLEPTGARYETVATRQLTPSAGPPGG